jgi:CrcB protein
VGLLASGVASAGEDGGLGAVGLAALAQGLGLAVALIWLAFGHNPPLSQVRRRMHVDRREVGAIFLGGFVGAVARAGLVETFPPAEGRWPWATFIANVVGAFLLGYLTTRLQERLPLSSYRRPLLGTGVCGALTTFSTMQLELLEMLDADRAGLAGTYAAISVVAGFLAVAVATNLVRRTRITS